MNKKGATAIAQILILVVGIVAISYAIGSGVGVVSADEGAGCTKETEKTDCISECVGSTWLSEGICRDGQCYYDSIVKDLTKCPYEEEDEEEGYYLEDEEDKYNIKIPETYIDEKGDIKEEHKGDVLNLIKGLTKVASDTYGTWNLYKGVKGEAEKIISTFKHSKEGLIKKVMPKGTEIITPTKWAKWIEANPGLHLAGQIIFNAAVAVTIYFSVREIALNQGQTPRQANSLGATFGGGYFSYKVTKIFIQNAIKKELAKKALEEVGKEIGKEAIKTAGLGSLLGTNAPLWLTTGVASFGIGLAVSLIIFSLTYKKRAFEVVAFQCNVWDAKSGGDDCELCNKQGILPCSEYQCKSLGRSCELVNKGTDKEMCVFVGRGDTEYPIIEPWEDALLEDYKYGLQNTGISPPDKGAYVKYQKSKKGDGCIPAFTSLSFGIILNEPAKCKVSLSRESSFEEMGNNYLSSGMSEYEHSYTIASSSSEVMEMEQLIFGNGGNYERYVRCEDAAGNSNPANFVFKFCADASPDLSPPSIIITDPLENSPILFGLNSTDVSVYVNKPADCRWSRADKSYDDMENTMTCASNMSEMTAQMLFKCSATLDGLEDRKENKFYFKCKSYPDKDESERVAMKQSYVYSLIGTQSLILDWAEPNETIKGSTEPIKVTLEARTSAGYDEGRSMCMYSQDGEMYLTFFGDEDFDNYQHSQDLWLVEDDYEYYIKCFDLGGNTDTKTIKFTVEADTESPMVVRIYREGEYLKLITDEKAECVYDTVDCSYEFSDGRSMYTSNDINHFVDWDANKNFYIKCADDYGNQPLSNKCSIIVRPFEIGT